MSQSLVDKIWNRAAMEEGGETPLEGDRALASMLLAHGIIMNGGVHHALECLDSEEIDSVVKGYSFFDLTEIGRFIASISTGSELSEWNEENEQMANEFYSGLVPEDNVLSDRFEAKFRIKPEYFASIEG